MQLIIMSSCKYFFLVIFLFIPNGLDLTQATLRQDEEMAKKLIAVDDVFQFFTQIGNFSEGYGEKWIVMPNGDGHPVLTAISNDTTDYKKTLIKISDEKVSENVKFVLYTPEHCDGEELNIEYLDDSNVDFSKPFKIICHGWLADTNSSVITHIRNAYLAEQNNNVIGVDWSYFSNDIIYPMAAKSTYSVGKYIGNVINNLVENYKTRYSDFHIIGHSLGAHVAGFAGSFTNEKIGRITGLDPALPGFQYVQGPDGRLDSSDAAFVDVIHTCSGLLGMSVPAGHVDFYPNGGSPFQPGCCDSFFLTDKQACSHSRSHEFFAESIYRKSQFSAVKCQDWNHFKHHECEDVFAEMGEYVSQNISGVFYLTTNEQSPFWKGLSGTVF